ncbi:MAG TPA: HIT domain-containing protein [Chthoniobacteraceae bacterium]|nr:HIT domain-containing protein [Chthoniobacteraceae bacterium]
MDEQFPKAVESIWAPWRVEYFSTEKTPGFLTAAAQAADDAAHLVVARRKATFLIMNRFPYAVGHMMAVPYRVVADIAELTGQERLELWELAVHAQQLLRKVASAQGFNIGLNLGKCAGAGYAEHLHLHIVPRWEGDNNFMPVLADTRVMPEALKSLYDKLIAAQREL